MEREDNVLDQKLNCWQVQASSWQAKKKKLGLVSHAEEV